MKKPQVHLMRIGKDWLHSLRWKKDAHGEKLVINSSPEIKLSSSRGGIFPPLGR